MQKIEKFEGSTVVTEHSGRSVSERDNDMEKIRHFHVWYDKLPMTFRLLRVQKLPHWANTSCVSIGDVIEVTTELLIGLCSFTMKCSSRC